MTTSTECLDYCPFKEETIIDTYISWCMHWRFTLHCTDLEKGHGNAIRTSLVWTPTPQACITPLVAYCNAQVRIEQGLVGWSKWSLALAKNSPCTKKSCCNKWHLILDRSGQCACWQYPHVQTRPWATVLAISLDGYFYFGQRLQPVAEHPLCPDFHLKNPMSWANDN